MEMFKATDAFIDKEQDAAPELRLWQAVIVSAVREWLSGPLRRQREAERYLFTDDSDFRVVCQSAGMDPGQLRARLLKLRSRGAMLADAGQRRN
jgi:hypothetical protein